MPFYRFEGLKSHRFNPHLSTAEGPVIEGQYLYFRMVTKRAGTGAELHYHPNELMAFPLAGRGDCVVGKDRRIIGPGDFVHFPPCARHGLKATEEADLKYLYIKDRTWTLVGSAADEALPEKARSAKEVERDVKAGKYPGQKKDPAKSRAIIEGLGRCYYPMIEALDAPPASGHSERRVEGTHLAFGFVESPPGHVEEAKKSAHEMFLYVIRGGLEATVAGEQKRVAAGEVVHVPRYAGYRLEVAGRGNVRYAAARSTPRLEEAIRKSGAADNWRG
ncbi:MAG: cupin domain-containing protein [Burkholderiales bacterium]|nr:cupin domain-containing protein [Burkholderiales bacterium]